MTIKVTTVKGFNDKEFEALKAALRTELPFRVTVRRHTQRYCWQAIDIRPVKANGNRRWTEEQAGIVCDFVKRNGYHITFSQHLDTPFIFQSGIHYIYQIA